MTVPGGYIYGTSRDGIAVIDARDDLNPVVTGTYTFGHPHAYAVRDTVVYLATDDGIVVVSSANPAVPREVGRLTTDRPVRDLALGGDFVYAVMGDQRLAVLPAHCRAPDTTAATTGLRPPRLRITGNPGLGGVVLAIEPSRAGPIDISAQDGAGRFVRRLFNELASSLPLELQWDGRDDAGHAVAPGIYFVRLTSNQGTVTSKAVIAR